MRSFILITALAGALFGNPAFAEETAARQEPVRIVTDQSAKAFIFIIDNEPVAMLDKTGLHVVGGVDYGASLTDAGPQEVQKIIASKVKEATHD